MTIYAGKEHAEDTYALHALSTLVVLGFKFLAWINGLGLVLIILCALGVIQTELTPYLLRLPLAAFICGLAFCGLGLLWGYFAQTTLAARFVLGRRQRAPWVPMLCLIVAYGLAMLAFVIGCWFTVNLASLVYQGSDSSSSPSEDGMSFNQSADGTGYLNGSERHLVLSSGRGANLR